MKQIADFLKEHDLKYELMNDETFVDEAKELFEKNGLKFSKEQLKEIVGKIDSNLKSVQKLPQKELINIVGGAPYDSGLPSADKSGSPPSKSAIAVEATMAIVGTFAGAGVGLFLGMGNTSGKVKDAEGKVVYTTNSRHVNYGAPVAGALVGSVVGFQFGKLIVRKYNL